MRVVASDAMAGAGASWFERYIQRQQYLTLIAADCDGGTIPGAATRWTTGGDGRTWTFWLRPDLRLADGSPLDAAAIVAAWQRDRADSVTWVGVADLTAVDAHALRIDLRHPLQDPLLFFHPAYALRGPAGGSSGTHAWLAPNGDIASPVGVHAVLEPNRPLAGRPPIVAQLMPAAMDHRDALDARRGDPTANAEVHVTRDPRVVAHARASGDWEVLPMGWDRTYVLTARSAGQERAAPTEQDLAALARDAVPGDARAVFGNPWWGIATDCLLPAPAMLPIGRQLGYDRRDPVAQALAERIVALALGGGATGWIPAILRSEPGRPGAARAVAMDSLALHRALAAGTVVAAISAVPSLPAPGCAARPPRLPGGDEIPLVQTRAWALVRGRLPPIVLLGDGTFYLTSPPR